jgi:hypothetical protein
MLNQGEEIPSRQRYCSSFYSIHLSATCVGRTTIFKEKICVSEITLLTTDSDPSPLSHRRNRMQTPKIKTNVEV